MVNITYPFLPPKEELIEYIDGIYERNWLTNLGPLATELENSLKNYLGLRNLLFVGNGTIALQIAIKALEIDGEIITTPFSYIATTTAIIWENCKPVFVDIDSETYNIDHSKIEDSITDKTKAILATHVFGNPCNIDEIEKIAKKHDLLVIYDAAHCFGVKYKGKSIFNYGDISATSFHATKLFHTVEGGAICASDEDLNNKISKMRNFGHVTPVSFEGIGINGKNSEFHAAMGLCNLNHINDILQNRKAQYEYYKEKLNDLPLKFQRIENNTQYNFSYFPILFEDEDILLKTIKDLEKKNVFTRRYFYPSLSTLEYLSYRDNTPVSEDIAMRILCLPMYHNLSEEEQSLVCREIQNSLY